MKQHVAQVNADANLKQSVGRSVHVASGQRLLDFDRAVHRGYSTGELNQKAVTYCFDLMSSMF